MAINENDNDNDNKVCPKSMISLFQIMNTTFKSSPNISYPLDGYISSMTDCHFQSMRRCLPEPTLFIKEIKNQLRNHCDHLLSHTMEIWMKLATKIITRTSYPYTGFTTKLSVGKYARYASFISYKFFTGYLNTTQFAEIQYPKSLDWPWSDDVKECKGEFRGWNCAFLPFSVLDPHSHSHLSQVNAYHHDKKEGSVTVDQLNISRYHRLDTHLDEVFKLRDTKKNHPVQMLLYGKILEIVSLPSILIKEFMLTNLRIIQSNIESGTPNSVLNKPVPLKYNSFLEFEHHQIHTRRKQEGLSVSMHVRQGDACDFFVDFEMNNMTTFLILFRYLQEQYDKEGVQAMSANNGSISSGDDDNDYYERHNRTSNNGSNTRRRNRQQRQLSKGPPLKKKRPCFTLDVYLKILHMLKDMYNVTTVYLATDSEEFIKRIESEVEFTWIYVYAHREFFDKDQGWVEFRKDSLNEGTLYSSVADMTLMKYGDIFIGGYASHFSKITYYMMVGYRQRLLPYISVDFPLGCDTIDSCKLDEEFLKDLTVEDMIARAPYADEWYKSLTPDP